MDIEATVTVQPGWLLAFRDLGVSPDEVLPRAGLSSDIFKVRDARIRPEQYFELWKIVEAEAGVPAFPIHVAQTVHMETIHPLMFAALCSPNLVLCVNRLAEYKRLMVPVNLNVEATRGEFVVEFFWDVPGLVVPAGLELLDLLMLTQLVRLATREFVRPLKVVGRFPEESLEEYEVFFGREPTLGKRHCLHFSLEDARRPFLTADSRIWTAFAPELERRYLELRRSESLTHKVKSVLIESLASGQASLSSVSNRLGMSARTLQRCLRDEGTSFKELVKQTRLELAYHYLENPDLSHKEISFLLGFSQPNSFSRAFKEWTGMTPDTVRARCGLCSGE